MLGRKLDFMHVAVRKTTCRVTGIVFGDCNAQGSLLRRVGVAAGIASGQNRGCCRYRFARVKRRLDRHAEFCEIS